MASSTQPYGKMLDYEQYIDHQLSRTRSRIKMTDLLTSSLILVVSAIALLFVEVVLDHAFGLPIWLRRIVLFTGLTGGIAFAVLRIGLPLIGRVNGLYAAKTIEESDPAFKNSLINYLDLKRRRTEISKAAMTAIEAKAVNDLTGIEIDAVVNQRRLIQVAYTLSAVLVLFCLYAFLTPKSIFDSAKRALLADVVRPTNTRLMNIKPGDDPELSQVVAGSHVPFFVDVSQGLRPDRVLLHYSVDGGKFYTVQEFTPGANRYDPWQTALHNVQQSLDYYLTGGDAESLKYHVEVTPAPMVTSVSIDYDFPRYLKLDRRPGIEGGNVEAIEGTIVTVHARTNEPARSAALSFPKADAVAMEVASSDPKELVGKFKVDKSGSYTIKFRTTGGQMNPDPVVHDIIALPDHAPTASFERPETPEIEVPSNVQVPLVMKASDDHGVKDVTLHVHQKGETLLSKNLLEQRPPTTTFRGTELLDLASWKVEPGSEVEYWLTVRDTKEPQSNRFETQRQKIKITAPLPPSEKKQADQKAQEEKRQDEEQQKAVAESSEPEPSEPAPQPRPDQEPRDRGEGADSQNSREANQPGAQKEDQGTVDSTEAPAQKADQREPRPMSPDDLQKLRELQKSLGINPPKPSNGSGSGTENTNSSAANSPKSGPSQGAPQTGANAAREPVSQASPPQPGSPNSAPQNSQPGNPQQPRGDASDVARGAIPNQTPSDPQQSQQPGGAQQQKPGDSQQPQPGGAQKPGDSQQPQPGGAQKPGESQQPQPGGAQKPGDSQQPQPSGAQKPGDAQQPQPGGMQKPGDAQQQQPGTQPMPDAENRAKDSPNQQRNSTDPREQPGMKPDENKRPVDRNETGRPDARAGEPQKKNAADPSAQPDQQENTRPSNLTDQQKAATGRNSESPSTKDEQSKTQKEATEKATATTKKSDQTKNRPQPESTKKAQEKTAAKKEQEKAAAKKDQEKKAEDKGPKYEIPKKEQEKKKAERKPQQPEEEPAPPEQRQPEPQEPPAMPSAPPQNPAAPPSPSGGSQSSSGGSADNQSGTQSNQSSSPGSPSPSGGEQGSKSGSGGSGGSGSKPGPGSSPGDQPGGGGQQGSPGSGSPSGNQPGSGSPSGNQPGSGSPSGNQPGSGSPSGNQPGSGSPSGNQPGSGSPTGNQPGSGTPTGNQPGSGSPTGNQPGSGSPTGNQPGSGSPSGNRPGSGSPSGNQPGSGSPTGNQSHPQGNMGRGAGEQAVKPSGTEKSATDPNAAQRSGEGRPTGDSARPNDAPSQGSGRNGEGANGSPAPGTPEQRQEGPATGQPTGETSQKAGPGASQDQQKGQGGGKGGGTTPSGGGRSAPGDAGEPMVPSTDDKGELPPRAETPPANSAETVAPDVPQTDLVLNKLEELLKRNQVTPELEQATGMSREEMEQFVTKMKKLDKAPAGPGREIQVKPGVDRTFDPNRTLPELNPNARLGNRTDRAKGSVAQDDLRDNVQGARFEVPRELRSGFEAYKSSLSRSKSRRPVTSGPGTE